MLAERLPYVTLLLRVRGNTEVERAALDRRRAFDALVASLVEEAERAGDIRADIDPKLAARLLFGTVNSIVEWYRPGSSTSATGAGGRGLRDRVRRAAGAPVSTSVAAARAAWLRPRNSAMSSLVAGDGDVVDAVAAVAGAHPALGGEHVAQPGRGDEDDVARRPPP